MVSRMIIIDMIFSVVGATGEVTSINEVSNADTNWRESENGQRIITVNF